MSLGVLFPPSLSVVDLVGCQIISLLELILKSIRELSRHLSLFIYEVLIAELPTLCLDKLLFFFFKM